MRKPYSREYWNCKFSGNTSTQYVTTHFLQTTVYKLRTFNKERDNHHVQQSNRLLLSLPDVGSARRRAQDRDCSDWWCPANEVCYMKRLYCLDSTGVCKYVPRCRKA
ncbi:hypothetical protein C0J52_14908 [Blattella germanica]|nr:hypothetical protein C0J52_14908 [Blattella germanica]